MRARASAHGDEGEPLPEGVVEAVLGLRRNPDAMCNGSSDKRSRDVCGRLSRKCRRATVLMPFDPSPPHTHHSLEE